MTEIEVETNIETDVKESDGLWYVYIFDSPISRGSRSREAAEALQRWLVAGLPDLADVFYGPILDKAFKETGK